MMSGNSSFQRRPVAAIAIALATIGTGDFFVAPTMLARPATAATQAPSPRAVALIEQAKLAFGRRQWARTVELAQRATRLDPDYSRPYVYIGLAREQQRRPDMARIAYLKVVELLPTQALSDPRRREDLDMARRRLKIVDVARPRATPRPQGTARPRPTPVISRPAIKPSPMKLQWKGETIALSMTPVLLRGTLMVPFGDVFKAAGGTTSYDALTRSVTALLPAEGARPETTIRIVINRDWADVNGKTFPLGTPALDYRDYAMVPLTFVTSVLHARPEYDLGAEIINIRPHTLDSDGTPTLITPPRVFDPGALKAWHTIAAAHAGGVRTVAWSPDGKLLASGGVDKMVKLWSLPAGTLKTTLPLHGGTVRSVAWSPDGSTLASGGADKMVRLWNPETGTLKKLLAPHGGEVRAVAWSPDGSTLASGSADKTVKLWNAASGEAKITFNFPAAIDALAWSSDNALLAVAISEARAGIGGEGEVRLVDAASGAVQSTLPLISKAESVAFSPDNKTWASTDGNYPVALRERNSRVQRALTGSRRGAVSLSFSPDGKWIASGGSDKIVRLSEAAGGVLKRELPALPDGIRALAFSPDGFALAAGTDDGSLHLWHME